jgi:hypothetical protein
VTHYLQAATISSEIASRDGLKALIVPHAGYIYSGIIAASAYKLLAARAQPVRRIVLIGPSHRVYFRGVAMPQAERFASPLGDIALQLDASPRSFVVRADQPHAMEHSLEVQLPFLQMLLPQFELVPFVTGEASPSEIGAVLDDAWGDDDTLIIASSDLSHYHDYATAQRLDAATSAAILSYDNELMGEQACGAGAINGLLFAARRRGLSIVEIARCNSGDTAGDRDRVVGYGAFALHEPTAH